MKETLEGTWEMLYHGDYLSIDMIHLIVKWENKVSISEEKSSKFHNSLNVIITGISKRVAFILLQQEGIDYQGYANFLLSILLSKQNTIQHTDWRELGMILAEPFDCMHDHIDFLSGP